MVGVVESDHSPTGCGALEDRESGSLKKGQGGLGEDIVPKLSQTGKGPHHG